VTFAVNTMKSPWNNLAVNQSSPLGISVVVI